MELSAAHLVSGPRSLTSSEGLDNIFGIRGVLVGLVPQCILKHPLGASLEAALMRHHGDSWGHTTSIGQGLAFTADF